MKENDIFVFFKFVDVCWYFRQFFGNDVFQSLTDLFAEKIFVTLLPTHLDLKNSVSCSCFTHRVHFKQSNVDCNNKSYFCSIWPTDIPECIAWGQALNTYYLCYQKPDQETHISFHSCSHSKFHLGATLVHY